MLSSFIITFLFKIILNALKAFEYFIQWHKLTCANMIHAPLNHKCGNANLVVCTIKNLNKKKIIVLCDL